MESEFNYDKIASVSSHESWASMANTWKQNASRCQHAQTTVLQLRFLEFFDLVDLLAFPKVLFEKQMGKDMRGEKHFTPADYTTRLCSYNILDLHERQRIEVLQRSRASRDTSGKGVLCHREGAASGFGAGQDESVRNRHEKHACHNDEIDERGHGLHWFVVYRVRIQVRIVSFCVIVCGRV